MQMRNLLRLMGALALTTGVATSVVACGTQATVNLDTVLKKKELGNVVVADVAQPSSKELKNAIKTENENINLDAITVEPIVPETGAIVSAKVIPDGKIYSGDPITVTFTLVVKKTDVEVTNDIKTALEKGVDGQSLNDAQTQNAAKDIITAAMKVVTDADKATKTATFTLDNGDTTLTVGDNNINIKVTLGDAKDVAVIVNLTGVKSHVAIKNPIGNTDAIKKASHKAFEKYYNSLSPMAKSLFDATAEGKGFSPYEYYLFLLKTGELPNPSVQQV